MRERVPRHQRSSRSTIISEIEKRGLSRYAASSRAAHTFANIYCLPHRTSLRSRQQGTGKDAHGIDDEFKNHVQGTGGFSVFVVFFNLVATFLTGYIVIGVPDNARELGFIALFPLTMCTCIGTFMNM